MFTAAPVFSLILDTDVREDIAMRYPELYKDLVKGRTLSLKTFFTWLVITIYQVWVCLCGYGSVCMCGCGCVCVSIGKTEKRRKMPFRMKIKTFKHHLHYHYQGGVIMFGALLLFDSDFIHIVIISFTSLIITEFIMVAITIQVGASILSVNLSQ